MKTKPKVLCCDCEHHWYMWHAHFCLVSPIEPEYDVVNGKNITEGMYIPCETENARGDCIKFVRKVTLREKLWYIFGRK